MLIVGLHLGHDAAIALVKDGRLVGTTSIERYTRVKKDMYMQKEHLEMFLSGFGHKIEDVDIFTLTAWSKSMAPFMDIYSPYGHRYPLAQFGTWAAQNNILNHLGEFPRVENKQHGYSLPDLIQRTERPYSSADINSTNNFPIVVKIKGIEKPFDGNFINHHLAHAASVFYTSDFDEAAIFTADASMHHPEACSGFFVGKGNIIQQFKQPGYMWGNFYDVATEHLGIGPGTTKAGSLMGLSAYGNVKQIGYDKWEEWTKPHHHQTDQEYHRFIDYVFSQISGRYPYIKDRKRPELSNPDGHHFNREWQYPYTKAESETQEGMDIAATIQYITERSLVKYSQELFEETKAFNGGNLCLAGGTFLNCNANYKIKTETDFDNVQIYPACGDDGTAAGSALVVAHQICKLPRQKYTTADLAYTGLTYQTEGTDGQPLDLDVIAEALNNDKIVCWYDGGSENGPRALGHRSFLTSPKSTNMKDTLNSRVKFREWYRPFAPIVLEEKASEWFTMDFPSPYMLYTVPCKKPVEIPAAVHIDNTSRVQTLSRDHNPKLYNLIEKFEEKSGIPIVINTSLNVKGEPIVETPADAVRLYNESDVDVLVINNQMWVRDAEE